MTAASTTAFHQKWANEVITFIQLQRLIGKLPRITEHNGNITAMLGEKRDYVTHLLIRSVE